MSWRVHNSNELWGAWNKWSIPQDQNYLCFASPQQYYGVHTCTHSALGGADRIQSLLPRGRGLLKKGNYIAGERAPQLVCGEMDSESGQLYFSTMPGAKWVTWTVLHYTCWQSSCLLCASASPRKKKNWLVRTQATRLNLLFMLVWRTWWHSFCNVYIYWHIDRCLSQPAVGKESSRQFHLLLSCLSE